MSIDINKHLRDNENLDDFFKSFAQIAAQTQETFIELAERLSKEAEAKAVAMAVEAADISECDHVGEYLYAIPHSTYEVYRCSICKETWSVDGRDE